MFFKCFSIGFLIGLLISVSFWILKAFGASNFIAWITVLIIWVCSIIFDFVMFYRGVKPISFLMVVSPEQTKLLNKGTRHSVWSASGGMFAIILVFVIYELTNI